MAEKAENIIELKHITKVYSDNGFKAVDDFNLEVKRGEFVTFLGPSGCGKTTTLRMIAGFELPSSGEILLDGRDIAHLPANKRPINTVFQRYALFPHMNVSDNVGYGLKIRKVPKAEIAESLAGVYKRFPRLEERKGQRAGTLSGGEQQMLAMGRALMSRPRIILMDEPSMGLSPIFVNEIFDIIREVSESGTTVLLVEQNAKKALSIADRAYVLETGRITLEGKASDLLHDESVQKAYLGE